MPSSLSLIRQELSGSWQLRGVAVIRVTTINSAAIDHGAVPRERETDAYNDLVKDGGRPLYPIDLLDEVFRHAEENGTGYPLGQRGTQPTPLYGCAVLIPSAEGPTPAHNSFLQIPQPSSRSDYHEAMHQHNR
jgi:hypothetical protein